MPSSINYCRASDRIFTQGSQSVPFRPDSSVSVARRTLPAVAVSEDLRPLAQQLNTRLHAIRSLYRFTRSRTPFWYGQMITGVVLLCDGDQIDYVSSTYSDDDGVEVVVLTQRLVIQVRATDISKATELASLSTRAWSRSKLIAVEVTSEESVFGDSAFSDWPGKLTVRLDSDGEPTITLPLEEPEGGDDRDALRDIIRAATAQLRR